MIVDDYIGLVFILVVSISTVTAVHAAPDSTTRQALGPDSATDEDPATSRTPGTVGSHLSTCEASDGGIVCLDDTVEYQTRPLPGGGRENLRRYLVFELYNNASETDQLKSVELSGGETSLSCRFTMRDAVNPQEQDYDFQPLRPGETQKVYCLAGSERLDQPYREAGETYTGTITQFQDNGLTGTSKLTIRVAGDTANPRTPEDDKPNTGPDVLVVHQTQEGETAYGDDVYVTWTGLPDTHRGKSGRVFLKPVGESGRENLDTVPLFNGETDGNRVQVSLPEQSETSLDGEVRVVVQPLTGQGRSIVSWKSEPFSIQSRNIDDTTLPRCTRSENGFEEDGLVCLDNTVKYQNMPLPGGSSDNRRQYLVFELLNNYTDTAILKSTDLSDGNGPVPCRFTMLDEIQPNEQRTGMPVRPGETQNVYCRVDPDGLDQTHQGDGERYTGTITIANENGSQDTSRLVIRLRDKPGFNPPNPNKTTPGDRTQRCPVPMPIECGPGLESQTVIQDNGCPTYECVKEDQAGDEETCSGCSYKGRCVPIGTRVDNGTARYCGLDQSFSEQKSPGSSCQNDYECTTNTCSSGECVDLQAELEEQQGLLNRIASFLRMA